MADWDVVIIGGGAAGLSAGAVAAGAGLSCLVLDRMGGGGELMNLGRLEDVGDALTGPDLMARLQEAAMTAGAELGIAEVTELARSGAGWRITTDDETHMARAVILAVGLAPGRLGIAEEDRFEGMGLSHCATCDGPLFAGQPVVVAGGDRWAVAEARELTATGSEVTLVTQDSAAPHAADGFKILPGRVIALEGDPGLEAVLIQPGEGGPPERLAAQGIFIQSGRHPALDFAPVDLARGADGRLIIDMTLQTNLPNLFAAGDARAGAARNLAQAMADGKRAAEAAIATLSPLGKSAASE